MVDVLTPKNISADLNKCLILVDKHATSIPRVFVDALIISEDHRSELHPGIDVIAIIRALYVWVKLGQVQGASTIEQQYVRVVSNRFKRTAARKFREQILAVMLARRTKKYAVASAYLSIAFYGAGSSGISGLTDKFGDDLSKVSFDQALRMVAQLKYPRPIHPSEEWHSKIEARLTMLINRAELSANNSFRSKMFCGTANFMR